MRRTVVLLTCALTSLASGALAQPAMPGMFEFALQAPSSPALASAGALDVRLLIVDANDPDRLLYERTVRGVDAHARRLRVTIEKSAMKRLSDRVVRLAYEIRPAGTAAWTYRSALSRPRQLLFEQPKTLYEKIRLDRWVIVGLLGQIIFMLRFLIQWIETERRRESVIPIAFWWFSIGGGLLLLVYALYRRDPVFIAGQAFGVFVYLRNLYFVMRDRRQAPAVAP